MLYGIISGYFALQQQQLLLLQMRVFHDLRPPLQLLLLLSTTWSSTVRFRSAHLKDPLELVGAAAGSEAL
ncbi:hypothetical protein CYMTET_56147 [Cymbomonas tetramitiformis]|uniref:Uncharacterized protein n=1 Tax=Cymbomonas tetramitiformis TaxID=36881 RepID=A0AAE0EM92_9CHLO|nr:hypothetical protein CYMTET_56147 [Cymbomonas tetramitiformis]